MDCLWEESHYSNNRNLLNNDDYVQYTQLYAAFTQYLPHVRFANRPVLTKTIAEQIDPKTKLVTVPKQDVYEIPRLYSDLESVENNPAKQKEIKEFETYHTNLWRAFEETVDLLCDNKYVQARFLGPNRPMSYAYIQASVKYNMPYDPTYASDLVRPRLADTHAEPPAPFEIPFAKDTVSSVESPTEPTRSEIDVVKERIKELLYAQVPG
jgi:hypothetical protein